MTKRNAYVITLFITVTSGGSPTHIVQLFMLFVFLCDTMIMVSVVTKHVGES